MTVRPLGSKMSVILLRYVENENSPEPKIWEASAPRPSSSLSWYRWTTRRSSWSHSTAATEQRATVTSGSLDTTPTRDNVTLNIARLIHDDATSLARGRLRAGRPWRKTKVGESVTVACCVYLWRRNCRECRWWPRCGGGEVVLMGVPARRGTLSIHATRWARAPLPAAAGDTIYHGLRRSNPHPPPPGVINI